MEAKFFPLDDHAPYSDRKVARDYDGPLDIETIVKIQQMACQGIRPSDIFHGWPSVQGRSGFAGFAAEGVTMEQIMALIDPPAERADTRRQRRQERAGVGFAAFKGRR